MGTSRPASRNVLLRRLPADEWRLLEPLLEPVSLEPGTLLCASGARIGHAVFPVSGVIALCASTSEGSFVQSGTIGRDGLFGLPLMAGLSHSAFAARVQGRGDAFRIGSRRFCLALDACPALGLRLRRCGLRLMDQVAQIAACNCHHTVEQRTARWILSTSDRMRSDVIAMKQSSLADMLGVLRPAINKAAGRLRAGGLVDYRRGEMEITDRVRLRALACSCYDVLGRAYAASLA